MGRASGLQSSALGSFLRQSSLPFTSVTSALEVFLNGMCHTNPRFTYLLTYLQQLLTVYNFGVQPNLE